MKRRFLAAVIFCSIVTPAFSQVSINMATTVAYWKLSWVSVNTETNIITFSLKGYPDKAAWQANVVALYERHYSMPIPPGAGSMTWAQLTAAIYAFVETLPDFAGSTNGN